MCSFTYGLVLFRFLHGLGARVGTRKTSFIHRKFHPVSIIFITITLGRLLVYVNANAGRS